MDIHLHDSERAEVEAVAKQIHDLINRSFTPHTLHVLAEKLATDHRTLVQGAMRDLVIPFIDFLATQGDDGRWDLRNEGSVKLAMALRDVIASSDIALPFV
jgi:hypothetical protein